MACPRRSSASIPRNHQGRRSDRAPPSGSATPGPGRARRHRSNCGRPTRSPRRPPGTTQPGKIGTHWPPSTTPRAGRTGCPAGTWSSTPPAKVREAAAQNRARHHAWACTRRADEATPSVEEIRPQDRGPGDEVQPPAQNADRLGHQPCTCRAPAAPYRQHPHQPVTPPSTTRTPATSPPPFQLFAAGASTPSGDEYHPRAQGAHRRPGTCRTTRCPAVPTSGRCRAPTSKVITSPWSATCKFSVDRARPASPRSPCPPAIPQR